MNEFYNKHYITTDAHSILISGWSDGPNPGKDTTGAICINSEAGYQFRLFPGGEENPPLYTMDGIPLYKYVDGEVIARTDGEISLDRESLRTEHEIIEQERKELEEVPMRMFKYLTQNVIPQVAAKAPSLYDLWRPGIKYGFSGCEKYVQHPTTSGGNRLGQTQKLFRCIQPHISQEGWEPNKTPALWAVINLENEGTLDDPIVARMGMEYTYGLYYKDQSDQKLYLCERTGEQAGGMVILQYLPHELIGHYFKEVK